MNIEEQKELNAIGKIIIKFLTSQFPYGTENEIIQYCVHKSRFPYITAQHDGDIPTETIVSCINFALLPKRGFYVNWLATSHEEITVEKYGPTFRCLCKGGITVQRNLGLFLMQAANFAVYSHLSTLNPDLPSFTVAFQAQIDPNESAQDFYNKNGFEEIDNISSMSDLDFVGFDGFKALIKLLKNLQLITLMSFLQVMVEKKVLCIVTLQESLALDYLLEKELIHIHNNLLRSIMHYTLHFPFVLKGRACCCLLLVLISSFYHL